jgi:predicted DNA-binding transcriptional regulator AlpA
MISNDAQPERLLNTAALMTRYNISDQTLRDWRKKFGFPEPTLVVNKRVHYWKEVPIKEWERARTAARTTAV